MVDDMYSGVRALLAEVLPEAQDPNLWAIDGVPVASVVAKVDASIAQRWLTERNPSHVDDPNGNRNISARANTYAKIMRGYLWRTSPQNVFAFDETGQLLDGQHRLTAIVRSNSAHEFLIQVGWPRSGFAVLDSQGSRRTSQFVSEKYAIDRIAAASVLAVVSGSAPAAEMASGSDAITGRPLTTEVGLRWLADWPEIDTFAGQAVKCYAASKIGRPLHIAVLSMASRTQYADQIGPWLEGLTSGAGLSATDPRLHLRNRWIKDSRLLNGSGSNRVAGYNSIVKMWNAFAAGKSVSILKATSGEAIQPVLGFKKMSPLR